ncbi:MAG: PTS sugar transporter subunit IIA [Chlamydiales bacterium]|nr:PTS sugar transporter subunit IIA [Chlamydiales bacterium]
MMIFDYLDPELVSFLDVETREQALATLVETLALHNKLKDKQAFLQAVIDREKLVSTGIGAGVAIPHAKLSAYDDFFIAVGILKKGVEWDALDGAPVRVIFMIGGPDDKQTEYLQILSRLTYALKEEDRRKKILQLSSPQEIVDLFNTI